MEQSKVLSLIKKEREYQDSRWSGDGKAPDDQKSPAEWLIYIRQHLYAAEMSIYNNDTPAVMHELRKIAALAVAALEVHGCPDRNK